MNWQDIPPIENSCLGFCAKDTKCYLTYSDCSEAAAVTVTAGRHARPENNVDELNVSDRTSRATNTVFTCPVKMTLKVPDHENWHEEINGTSEEKAGKGSRLLTCLGSLN